MSNKPNVGSEPKSHPTWKPFPARGEERYRSMRTAFQRWLRLVIVMSVGALATAEPEGGRHP
jgi:hypothetical protein